MTVSASSGGCCVLAAAASRRRVSAGGGAPAGDDPCCEPSGGGRRSVGRGAVWLPRRTVSGGSSRSVMSVTIQREGFMRIDLVVAALHSAGQFHVRHRAIGIFAADGDE